MKHSFFKFCGGLFLAGCLFAVTSCNPQRSSNRSPNPPSQQTPAQTATKVTSEATQDHYDFADLDNILEQAAPDFGGCALLLIKDEKVVYRKSFSGFGPEKVVPIASASKWLSGALIMTLVDDGKLSLDDKVSKYIPEFSDKSEITIRHLFAHTSGLPPEARCRNDKGTTLERCSKEIARLQLRAAPGEEFHYGGVSMHVGGRIAEIVSGKSWHDLFAQKIAVPLGMSQTDFLAYGQTSNPRPEGDGRSSADDYGRFLQMILHRGSFNGKQVLSAASLAEMHKDHTGDARIVYTIYEKKSALDPNLPLARYGIGVWREKVDESSKQLREASSHGALGFSPWVDVERNLAGVLSVRSSFSRVLPVYLKLKDEIRRIVPADNNPLLLH